MAVNSSVLLVLRKSVRTGRLTRMVEVEPGKFVLPLRWLRRPLGGQLLDASLTLSCIDGVRLAGVPSHRTLGAPVFSYALLLSLGWLTLSTPILVRFNLSKPRALSLNEAKEFVDQIVAQDARLEGGQAVRLRQQILLADSVADMARAIAQVCD